MPDPCRAWYITDPDAAGRSLRRAVVAYGLAVSAGAVSSYRHRLIMLTLGTYFHIVLPSEHEQTDLVGDAAGVNHHIEGAQPFLDKATRWISASALPSMGKSLAP